jgi:hypothetical protein
MTARVSLAELAGAEIHLHPAEAVAIVAELCRRQSHGELRGVPSPGTIRLSADGDVLVEGPIPAAGAAGSIARMAQLLSDMLPGFDAAPQLRARGGLRLVIARALGTVDLPPYDSLADFSAALDRFAAGDLHECARGLVRAFERRTSNPAAPREPLTISDVRRARRATGLTLDDIASVADVPASELRALEWGDLRAWPRTAVGRDRIFRYARAAGLDEQIVFSVVWPLIDESPAIVDAVPVTVRQASSASSPQAAQALVPARAPALVPIEQPKPAPPTDRRVWIAWGVAAVALVLLAMTVIALARERALRTLPPPAPVRAARVEVIPLSAAEPIAAGVVPASDRSSSSVHGPSRGVAKSDTRVPGVKRSPARRPPPEKKSLLERELFRIVFR